ncbi:MAG TPA: hypothetical protein VFM77_16265 [Terriglobales bacterium]|nr:hypothetical protein [Terriglobales bacterium]
MFCRQFTVAALALGLTLTGSAATQQHKSHKPKASKPAVQPEPAPAPQQQAAPQPPPTPEHGPSSPAEVTFRNGQLTIVARNSTLSDVLNQVRSKTGASIDMPAAPSSDRVVGQFGPGAPRDVMAQLLNGSHFDYVMVGSPSDPSGLKKVVLTAKMNGPLPAPQQQPNNPAQAYNPGMQVAPQIDQDQQDQPTEDSTDAQPDSAPQSEQQEEPQGEQPPQQPNPNGGPVVKTPEQLLRELQQQQQQQQNQGQPPQQ